MKWFILQESRVYAAFVTLPAPKHLVQWLFSSQGAPPVQTRSNASSFTLAGLTVSRLTLQGEWIKMNWKNVLLQLLLGDGRGRRRKKGEQTGLAPVFALGWVFCLYTSQLTVRPFHLNLERHHPTDISQSWSHLIISTNTTAGRSIAKGSMF